MDSFDHIVVVFFELKFRGMDSHNNEAFVCISQVPFLQKWKSADAVDAGIGPKIDQDDLAPELFHRIGTAIDPSPDATELWGQVSHLTTDLSNRVGRG